ncbi:MAG TPA: TetR/AcrR family transcriptional regulator [Armatimonadota bacterium]|nr:TetR/AcrR family transcriptional regulator [Armatimonadota bacterium]
MSRNGRGATEQATRKRILKSAETVFAKQGFRGATIEAISAKAKVNRALLYYYFESKEHIYGILVEQGAQVFQEILDRASSADAKPLPKLAEFIREYINLCFEDRGLARMVRRELASAGEGAKLLAMPFGEIIQRVAVLLHEASEAGDIGNVDSELAACSLIGMMNVFHDLAILGGPPVDVDAAADHTLALFLNGARVD